MISFVPTPIGNRDDITQRALQTLQEADLITCEDTRHSSPLLSHYGISKPLIALHDHNEAKKTPELIEKAQSGTHIAVITDAGMPVGSGFPVHAFSFGGFLPVKKGKRAKALTAAIESDTTALFFESPHRILSTLEILSNEYPDQIVCVARELTKKFETYHRGTSSEMYQHFSKHKAKGEIVFLLAPSDFELAKPMAPPS